MEALPIGNGNLGAMCHGGVARELLQLNDDAFWSGAPDPWDVDIREAIERSRTAALAGDSVEADAAARQAQGPFTESYLPLADLSVELAHGDARFAEYTRMLDLDRGVVTVEYVLGGARYRRTAFVSAVAGVLVLRVRADAPFEVDVSLDAVLPHTAQIDCDVLVLNVRAPAHVVPHYIEDDAPIRYDDRGMHAAVVASVVRSPNEVVVLVSSATGFRGFAAQPDLSAQECIDAARQRVDAAVGAGYGRLVHDHVAEHRQWFGRVDLELAGGCDAATTPELLERAAHDDVAARSLVELLFHYGRYLLIASSRPGTQPANLQGIWNKDARPAWSSNYTININTQMNYWPAEPAGLPELHEPLLDLVDDSAVTGAATAQRNYGLPGWVAHHNTDLWRRSNCVGERLLDPCHASWWLGAAWLAHHAWEHFAYSLREDDLCRAYPVLRGAAEFLSGWLVEDVDGSLLTAPSTSPENTFRTEDGRLAAVTTVATMDLALIAQLFDETIAAARLLDEDEEFAASLADERQRLRRPGVGTRGQLLEWDRELPEVDPKHRHVSHLVGIYPGDVHLADPALREAARVTLDERGDASTGWSRAWKACLWARLGDGDRAWSILRGFCSEVTTEEFAEDGGIYANLFCAHPPFQIDGSFGITAAVCELLVASTIDEVELLPALPAAWPRGSVRGLRARGALGVDVSWENGALAAATLRPAVNRACRVLYRDRVLELEATAGAVYELDAQLTLPRR